MDQLAKSAPSNTAPTSILFHTPTSSLTSGSPSPTHGSINFQKILVVTLFTPEYNPPYPPNHDFPQFSRKTIVTICRLRFGHNPLPATLSKFIPTICPYWPLHLETKTLATRNHLFFQCPKLKTLVQKFELLLAYNFPGHGPLPVSYTHLTLPTIYSV